ncbi:helix-turn-helix domain-containing protein [Myroides sp. C15-4]|uniref:helix-turn-helix domain-containing protein n=1 Tax=Myroides sp. C15-4 TaxID=3400532 RepID=UPI003D2F98E8
MEQDEIIKGIGNQIRAQRELKKLTLMQFADKLNIEYNNLIRIEKGRTNPTIGTLINICNQLDIKLKDLVDVY